jgi:hypothetical protein
MAITITRVPDAVGVPLAHLRTSIVDVTLDTSYVAGGYAINARDVGLGTLLGGLILGGNAAGGRVLPWLDHANAAGEEKTSVKLMLYFPSGGGAASPTSLTDPAITSGAVAVTSAAANGAADLTPGQGKEVGATANVSSLRYRILFFGSR